MVVGILTVLLCAMGLGLMVIMLGFDDGEGE